MNFKKLIFICVWIICLFLIDHSLSFLLKHLLLSSQLRYSRLYSGSIKSDLIVLGNSRGVNGFYIPLIQNISCMKASNLSYNGMSVDIAEVILVDFIKFNNIPKVVILEISCIGYGNDLLSELRGYTNISSAIDNLDSQYNPFLNKLSKVFNLIRYNNEMFLRSLYYMKKSDQKWINNGYIDEKKALNWKPSKNDKYYSHNINEKSVKSLNNIQRICIENKIELFLVITPYLPSYNKYFSNLKRKWLSNLKANILYDSKIYDFSEALEENSFFADPLHINIDGSKAFSNVLKNSGIFKSKKIDYKKPTLELKECM